VEQPQTVNTVYPAANGHSAVLHQQYLQAAQEFNRALVAMTQVEQDLVRLGNQNGNHQHLEVVINRMTRLLDHQETMLNIHASMLQQTPVAAPVKPQPAMTTTMPTMAAPQPQVLAVAAPAPVVTQAPVVQTAPKVETAPTPEPVVVQESPAPVEEPVSNPNAGGGVDALLLRVVADKTGYPEETLDLEMSMEADLGIDSIKRVEILGAMQEEMPAIDEIDMEELGGLTTLQDVVTFMSTQADSAKKA